MTDRHRTIATLNDVFRQTFAGGRVNVTRGIADLGERTVGAILCKVRRFDQFSIDNDPHHEHDFGSFEHDGEKIFWKIDYYDTALVWGSPDPSDPRQTSRVLTIMLASEY